MADIIDQYGDVIIYSEEGHPTPFYEFNGQIAANPYGVLQVLLDDDDLEEVMYNGGKQCVKIAHRKHGMCRTNIWVEDEEGIQITSTTWPKGLGWTKALLRYWWRSWTSWRGYFGFSRKDDLR